MRRPHHLLYHGAARRSTARPTVPTEPDLRTEAAAHDVEASGAAGRTVEPVRSSAVATIPSRSGAEMVAILNRLSLASH